MPQPYPPNRKQLARKLRNNATDAETRLWQRLRRRQLGVRFLRQRPIGPYIVDFYCPACALVIEVDGGQHFSDEGRRSDEERDQYLRQQGLRVLRFDNRQVLLEMEGVVEAIYQTLNPPRSPLR